MPSGKSVLVFATIVKEGSTVKGVSQQARIVETISRMGIREIHDFITSNCRGRTKDYHIIPTGGGHSPFTFRNFAPLYISTQSCPHQWHSNDGIAISLSHQGTEDEKYPITEQNGPVSVLRTDYCHSPPLFYLSG